jgi:hypothetical protein
VNWTGLTLLLELVKHGPPMLFVWISEALSASACVQKWGYNQPKFRFLKAAKMVVLPSRNKKN